MFSNSITLCSRTYVHWITLTCRVPVHVSSSYSTSYIQYIYSTSSSYPTVHATRTCILLPYMHPPPTLQPLHASSSYPTCILLPCMHPSPTLQPLHASSSYPTATTCILLPCMHPPPTLQPLHASSSYPTATTCVLLLPYMYHRTVHVSYRYMHHPTSTLHHVSS